MNILEKLEEIQLQLDKLSEQIQYEEKVMKAELKHRIEQELEGQKAIDHYNRWMKTAGLYHMLIE